MGSLSWWRTSKLVTIFIRIYNGLHNILSVESICSQELLNTTSFSLHTEMIEVSDMNYLSWLVANVCQNSGCS
jgi:hypothetical protein